MSEDIIILSYLVIHAYHYLTCTTLNHTEKKLHPSAIRISFPLKSVTNYQTFIEQINLKSCPNYVLASALMILRAVLLPYRAILVWCPSFGLLFREY